MSISKYGESKKINKVSKTEEELAEQLQKVGSSFKKKSKGSSDVKESTKNKK